MDVAIVQRRLGVRADGDFGPMTLAALLRKLGAPAGTAAPLAGGVEALEGAVILASGLRLAHFLAQAGHETMGFARMVEIWGPTAAQRRYEGRELRPGETMEVDIAFWRAPGLGELLHPGRRWRIQEGLKLVGIGTVAAVLL